MILGESFKGLDDLIEGPFSIIIGVDVVEDGTFDLLHGDFTVIVGINLIEDLLDLSFPALWEFVVVCSGESSDGISEFFHVEALVSVGVNFLEHLIEWHRLFDLKGNKGCLWDMSQP